MRTLIFVTGNSGKVREASSILAPMGIKLVQEEMDLPEIQDKDPAKVSEHKAREAFSRLKKPIIVEDTGLRLEAMGGYPGALIKHFLDALGRQGIVDFVRGKDPSAEAACVVTYCGPDGKTKSFRGSVKGRISGKVTQGYDFGWDPIFIPEGQEKTFAEMGMEEKNAVSHRMRALEKLASWLSSNPR